MAYQTTHNANDEKGRVNRGSIIGIHDKSKITEPPNLSGKLMFIHCLDAPFNNLDELSYLLEPVINLATVNQEILHRKRWLGDYSKIVTNLPGKYEQLRDTKETEINWDDIKSLLVDVETGEYHG